MTPIASRTTETYTPDNLIAGNEPPALARKITLLSGAGALLRGTVLGKIGLGAAVSAAKSGGNTGNGTLTMDVTTPVRTGAKAGVYTVRVISRASGTVAAAGTSAAVAGSTGNGTITASPATGAGAKQGVYSIVCVEPGADAGSFEVRDPDGIVLGRAVPGTPFTAHITFTITDGGTDFVAGDAFTVTVAGEQDETFRVTDPDGLVLGDVAVSGVSGTGAFDNDLKFVLTDGSTDFIVGDGFDITVAAGSGKYIKSLSAAVNGSQTPDCVLAEDADATSADAEALVFETGYFNANAITLGASHTLASIREGLRVKGIHFTVGQGA